MADQCDDAFNGFTERLRSVGLRNFGDGVVLVEAVDSEVSSEFKAAEPESSTIVLTLDVDGVGAGFVVAGGDGTTAGGAITTPAAAKYVILRHTFISGTTEFHKNHPSMGY